MADFESMTPHVLHKYDNAVFRNYAVRGTDTSGTLGEHEIIEGMHALHGSNKFTTPLEFAESLALSNELRMTEQEGEQ